MENKKIRVRFAPSPTGMMHLGSVMTALTNYLFAKQNNGEFILRIEDTDPERNFDPGAKKIIEDLNWLELNYDEGPVVGGKFEPYFQSQRSNIYQENLNKLIEQKKVYRCFCTQEELETKKNRQIALKMAPRYDRTCCKLTEEQINEKLDSNTPFIWRMKLNLDSKVAITDLAHGKVTFEFKNFADFPLTRQDGTFTFMFSNFVDDMTMNITHIIRGGDHLSNTAMQAALFLAFDQELPTYWHLPILCNIEGKKLSKRDFGFSLRDLKAAGYLPEAICNYIAILGTSFEQEIMNMDELSKNVDLSHPQAKSQVKYDPNKLKWINHKWLNKIEIKKLTDLCLEFILPVYPEAKKFEDKQEKQKLEKIIEILRPGLTTLADINSEISFLFKRPDFDKNKFNQEFESISGSEKETTNKINIIIKENINYLKENENNAHEFLENVKIKIKNENLKTKDVFCFLRLAIIGSSKGPGVGELIEILGNSESKSRLEKIL